MARSYRFKSDAELEEERSERELARNRRIATYGTNIPNVADVRAREQMDREARLEESAVASGRPAEEAKEYARALASGSRLEASKFEQQQRDKARQADYERTGFRTEGDRATYRTQEALRKLLNKPSAAVQFAANIDKSVALGDKSALNTEAGLERAYEQGTRAGFSRQDIDQMIGRATARQKDMAAQKPRQYTDAEISAMQGFPTAEQQARDVAAAEKEYSAKKTAAGGAEFYGPPSSAATRAKPTGGGEPVVIDAIEPRSVGDENVGGLGVDSLQGAGSLSLLGRRLGDVAEGVVAASRELPVSEIAAKTKAAKTAARLGGGRTPIAGTPYARAVETAKKGERLLKVARPLESASGVAKKAAPYLKGVSKAVGKVAVPLDLAMSVADVARFASDENRRQEVLSEFEKMEKQGALRRALSGALDPANTLLATGSNIRSALATQQRALESEAAAETAARRNEQIQRLLREERPDYALTPEEVRGLSPEDRRARAAYLTSLRRRVTAQ